VLCDQRDRQATDVTRLLQLTALVALLAAMAFALQAQARPQGATARVIDRTMVCSAALNGGIFEVEMSAQAGAVRRRSTWRKPAIAMLTTGNTASSAQALDHVLAWGVAGAPTRDATVIPDPFPGFTYPIRAWGTLAMTTRCGVSRARPALSSGGLRGGRVDALGQTFDCPSPRRVLVRVRAVLAADSSLTTRRGNLGTTVPVTDVRIVLATPTGKRLAYTALAASGSARLFTAPSCVRD
jgi:hypothetical protein